MKYFETEVIITSTPEVIWSELVNAKNLTQWDSGIHMIEGQIHNKSKFVLFADTDKNRGFKITVKEFSPHEKMVWFSGAPLGMFSGERVFLLTPTEKGVVFKMREEFRGLLHRLILKAMPDMQVVFDQFAAGLKEICEANNNQVNS